MIHLPLESVVPLHPQDRKLQIQGSQKDKARDASIFPVWIVCNMITQKVADSRRSK